MCLTEWIRQSTRNSVSRRLCRLVEFDTDETRSRSRHALGHERVRTTQRDPPRGPSQEKHAEQNIAYEIWPGDFDSCAAAAARATGGIGAADPGGSRRQHQAPSRLASSYQGHAIPPEHNCARSVPGLRPSHGVGTHQHGRKAEARRQLCQLLDGRAASHGACLDRSDTPTMISKDPTRSPSNYNHHRGQSRTFRIETDIVYRPVTTDPDGAVSNGAGARDLLHHGSRPR
jgi:hypothetical protein